MDSVQRPWGEYTVLATTDSFQIKRIVVRSGERLSLQRHQHRDEHWFVVSGRLTVRVDDVQTVIDAGMSIDVPRTVAHRMAAHHGTDVTLIEVQTGDAFDEDDIERIEDDYGR